MIKEKSATIGGLNINYKIAGQGPAILILHGWGSDSGKWKEVGELLEKRGYQAIIPDLPGFGRSSEPRRVWNLGDYCRFVEEFIGYFNLEKFSLLGHSFGGALAVKCSLKFPERIDRLFLVGAACFREKTARKKIFYIIAKILKIISFLPGYQYMRKGFYRFIVGRSDYPYLAGIMRDVYLEIIKEDVSPLLPLVRLPTIIIWGELDRFTPLKYAYLIKEKIKNSELIVFNGIGHSPQLEEPEKLVGAMLKYGV